MATPSENLARSLSELKRFQNEDGIAVIRSADLSRKHRERLLANGFIREVIRGWYVSANPGEKPGDTTSWYRSFWHFASSYLNSRFGDNWCLSPEQSLLIHSGNFTVPKQLVIRSPEGGNNIIELIFGISILDLKLAIPDRSSRIRVKNIQVYSIPDALIACGSDIFTRYPADARICLAMAADSSLILAKILDGGKSAVAGRLAGAFRNSGNQALADEILQTMKGIGYDVREDDPFAQKVQVSTSFRSPLPSTVRIRLIWDQMRTVVTGCFPSPPGIPGSIDEYLGKVDDHFIEDAYNSLSIEGYAVTTQLIEKIRDGKWDPVVNPEDKKERDALAAKGYYDAFQAVKASIRKILEGMDPGSVAESDHLGWYRSLFGPSVSAGLLKPSDLAGYRNGQVYIRGSRHIPLGPEAVWEAMSALFDLLKAEPEPSAKAVLGHFLLVYVHPWMDGNGRIGRFLFNTMLASGGYPWTVIPVERRDEYMACLEKASVDQDISDFARFLGSLLPVSEDGRNN
jgi:hypothetical protein